METKTKAYSYIRFSRPDQIKGDSLRRQLEASEKYAKENKLTLDKSLSLQDLGLSAFHGVHKAKGKLGLFLKLVQDGKIPKGSVLIVENFDRLSRQEILTALNQFTNIIEAGITLFTLQDGMKYSKESVTDNWTQLIISITYMARAWDESKRKSQRLSDTWENKRLNGEKKLTAKAPLWLKLNKERTEYTVIPEAGKTIELIFNWKLDGKGVESIAKELNQRNDLWIPPHNKKRKTGGWRGSYIHKILTTKAVIGEFTPHRLVNNKREPEPTRKKYFPAVISEELFYSVQDLLHRRAEISGHLGGQTGKANNLFTHVVSCGLCKAPMHFIDKGKPPKGGQYLHCDNSRRSLGCSAKVVRYDEFEKLFFDNFEELNIADLLPDKDEIQIQIHDKERKQVANKSLLKDLQAQEENLVDSIATTRDERVRRTLNDRLIKVLDEKASVTRWNEALTKQLKELTEEADNLRLNIDHTKEVYGLLAECKDETEKISLRLRLREEIRKIVSSIEIYPLMEEYAPLKEKEVDSGVYVKMKSKFIDHVRIRFKGISKSRLLALKIGFDAN